MFDSYKIKDADVFSIHRYPEVENEIAVVSQQLSKLKADHKSEIVISFLKDHSIRTAWLQSSHDVVRMMTSGALKTKQTEALFNACRQNNEFRTGFELYISSTVDSKVN